MSVFCAKSTVTNSGVIITGGELALNLSASLIGGTLAIGDGGTGQSSKTAAFDALAPTTTNGDMIYYNGSDNVRLGTSSNGYVLTLDGGIPAWKAAPGSGNVSADSSVAGRIPFWYDTNKKLNSTFPIVSLPMGRLLTYQLENLFLAFQNHYSIHQ